MTEKSKKNFVLHQGREYFVKNEALDLSLQAIKDITTIKGLDSLTDLKELDLSGNEISEIDGLDKLVRLESLDLQYNKISEISGLNKLTNVKELRFGGNIITEIEGLENLRNLEDLSLPLENRIM